MLKNKRAALIVGAIVFVAVIFLLKTKSDYKSQASLDSGLSYGNIMMRDLLNKDTDQDGVLDWQENLMGTDPTKKETTPGIPDKVAIQKIEDANKVAIESEGGETAVTAENLTQTDKFSQELFSTVATLNQAGEIDQITVDKLSTSLVDQIKNSPTRKIYTMEEINIIKNSDISAIKKYDKDTDIIFAKYPTHTNIVSILEDSMTQDGEIDSTVLQKLNGPVGQLQKIISEMITVEVPKDLSSLHFDVINALEKVAENLSDIQLIDVDSIVALGAIGQYEDNNTKLELAFTNMINVIKQKLNN